MSKKLQSVHLMTGLQESLFAFEASAEAGMRQSAYVEQFTCKLTGGVDVLALSGAWGQIVRITRWRRRHFSPRCRPSF